MCNSYRLSYIIETHLLDLHLFAFNLTPVRYNSIVFKMHYERDELAMVATAP